jgi:hypothetical protein
MSRRESRVLEEQVTKELEPIPVAIERSSSATSRRRWPHRVVLVAGILLSILVLASIGYYLGVRSTPEYSLALLIDAARAGNQTEMERYLDTSRVIEDFSSQVLEEVAALYGRGMSAELLKELADASLIVTPAVEGRVAAELPEFLKRETAGLSDLPFWLVVIGTDRYTLVEIDGDRAEVRPTDRKDGRSVIMMRSDDRWRVVAVRDRVLARELAQKFGNDIMTLAREGDISGFADLFGVKGFSDLLERLDAMFE